MSASSKLPVSPAELVGKFDAPGVEAIVLMGSYAAGNAGPFSDIDLVRLVEKGAEPPLSGSHLPGDTLVVVSNVSPAEVEAWFTKPEVAVKVIAGLRTARALLDRDEKFAAIQARAKAFEWDSVMQAKADHWASQQMVGWIEEVHKGLEGLRRNNTGRLLNSLFGCSWGLSNLLQVQRGILVSGDNGFYDEVEAGSEWVELRRAAFGIEGKPGRAPTLRQQVIAGLRLYALTAELVKEALEPADRPMVEQTVALVNRELAKY